jgi:hypothetical protein
MAADPAVPHRQIRAAHTASTITVYQAYSPAIAEPAVAAGRFVAPFKRDRMTWIKPSLLWMAYRSGLPTPRTLAGPSSATELDEVIDGLTEPGMEVIKLLPPLPTGIGKVVDDHNPLAGAFPARDVVSVLSGRERHQCPIWIALLETGVAISERLPVDDPPRLKCGKAELDRSDE